MRAHLSFSMGPAPILKMAVSYGLHPRLWLLSMSNSVVVWVKVPPLAGESANRQLVSSLCSLDGSLEGTFASGVDGWSRSFGRESAGDDNQLASSLSIATTSAASSRC